MPRHPKGGYDWALDMASLREAKYDKRRRFIEPRCEFLREFACRDGAEPVRLNAYASHDVERAEKDAEYCSKRRKVQNIKKHATPMTTFFIFTLGIFLLQGFLARASEELSFGLCTGFGAMVGSPEKVEHGGFAEYPSIFRLGLIVNRKVGVSIEGQVGFAGSGELGLVMGSIVGTYYFSVEKIPRIRPLIMLGIGYGLVLFNNESTESNDESGPFQVQVGGGLEYSLFEWFVLGGDVRLRMGFPNNPDVVNLALLFCATFRL